MAPVVWTCWFPLNILFKSHIITKLHIHLFISEEPISLSILLSQNRWPGLSIETEKISIFQVTSCSQIQIGCRYEKLCPIYLSQRNEVIGFFKTSLIRIGSCGSFSNLNFIIITPDDVELHYYKVQKCLMMSIVLFKLA